MLDRLGVQRFGIVATDALQSEEDLPRRQSQELVHADIAHLSAIAVQTVLQDADLLDRKLSAEALTRLTLDEDLL
jgi:hypothetical protein